GNGIWSGLDDESKAALNERILSDLQDLVVRDNTTPEFRMLEKKKIKQRQIRDQKEKQNAPQQKQTLNHLAKRCGDAAARVFHPTIKETAFQGMYSLPVIDSLVETVGRVVAMPQSAALYDRKYEPQMAVFLVSGFVPSGGGVFREIKEIVYALLARNFEVLIVSTGKIETDESVIRTHFSDASISYFANDTGLAESEAIGAIQDILASANADRIYPFLTHHDVVGFAALQKGFARRIIFDFVYDHGLSLGIHHSAIDTIVTKNNSQASAIAATVRPEKLVMLAPFLTDKSSGKEYVPRKNKRLTTATAAARSYKIDTDYRHSYYDVILQIMKKLDVQHIHYGPLPDAGMSIISTQMKAEGLSDDQFVHIPWANDFGGSLVQQGVDVFIAPFPICSARIGVEVMSYGIPSINHRALAPTLPEAGDFVSPGQPCWNEPADLLATLATLDEDKLAELSRETRQFFLEQNEAGVSLEKFCKNAFDLPVINDTHPFQLSDLSTASFTEIDAFSAFGVDALSRIKFWQRGPLRQKIRSKFHRAKTRFGL
ncbi:MAG: hypothetical protein AAFX07_02515, partial [Pseudomonadota bacterium]